MAMRVPEDLSDRLTEVLRRTTSKLPAEMQSDFAALISPENLAITVGVLVVWAGSHAFGVGEVVDLGLLAFGLIMLGTMALDIAGDITRALELAVNAKKSEDLDAAATHLAKAIALLGVTLFTALVLKHAAKAAPRIAPSFKGKLMPAVSRYMGFTVEEWLYKAGFRQMAPTPRNGAAKALELFHEKRSFMKESDALKWLKAMDLSKKVESVTFTAGREIVGYMEVKPTVLARIKAHPEKTAEILRSLQDGDVIIGRFFTKGGTGMDRLGIADQNRIFCRFQVQGSVSAVESATSATADTWTVRGWKQYVGGGGTQYILPDARYLYSTGQIKLTSFGSKIKTW